MRHTVRRAAVAAAVSASLAASAVASEVWHGAKLPPAARHALTVHDAWRALPAIRGQGCGEDLVFDYGAAGGMRNFFCRALTVFSWRTLLQLAPTTPFRSGPHKAGKLDLHAADFGRYDPAFVRWAVGALAPGIADGAFRAETQGVYDAQVRPLARTVRAVRGALTADPARLARLRGAYTAALRARATDGALDELYDLLGDSEGSWGGYDPNVVRSVALWWLRRELDGTAALWADGLERLVGAYDAAWLQALRQAVPPRTGPTPPVPEYR